MPVKKKRGDQRNLLILVLTFIVAVETYVLLIHKKGPGAAGHRMTVAAAPKTKRTVAVPAPPARPTAQLIAPQVAEPSPPVSVQTPAPRPAATPPALKSSTGSSLIAIILDDWGYNESHCENLAQIEAPVTVAVLPHLSHSIDVANCAFQQKKEVMLHFPMEPHWNQDEYPKDYIVRTTMPKAKVIELLDKALKSVPHAVGVNNHMGSKATEDRRLMSIVFESLRDRKLFFVDSYVTAESVCGELAREVKLPFVRRDVFLDKQNERRYIEKQFELLAKEAREKGYAVGIGHDRVLTLEIVKEQTKLLRQQGFRIITVQELIKHL